MFIKIAFIKKLPNGKFRIYSRKKTDGKRKNLGTYDSFKAALEREKQIQFFKQHADDGMADDHETKTLSRLSDIAAYLEEAGFIEPANKIYMVMNAIDGSLAEEDYIIDPLVKNDEQMNVGGGEGFSDMSPGHGGPSMSMDVATLGKLVDLSNKLDKLGAYEEADAIDEVLYVLDAEKMGDIIEELEEGQKHRPQKEHKKQKTEVLTRSNGKDTISVIDNQGCGMFQGYSDTRLSQNYGDLEGQFGPNDRN